MNYQVLLLIAGIILIVFHAFAPDAVPFGIDLILGLLATAAFLVLFIRWWVVGIREHPAVERFAPDREDLKRATPEILYLLEDGWGIKRIVDMIAANYQLPPKMVYEHTMELMSRKQDGEQGNRDFIRSEPVGPAGPNYRGPIGFTGIEEDPDSPQQPGERWITDNSEDE